MIRSATGVEVNDDVTRLRVSSVNFVETVLIEEPRDQARVINPRASRGESQAMAIVPKHWMRTEAATNWFPGGSKGFEPTHELRIIARGFLIIRDGFPD